MSLIYGLIDPRNGLLYYVGRTWYPKSRLSQHLTNARGCRHENMLVHLWTRSILKQGLIPEIAALASNISGDIRSCALEIDVIKQNSHEWPLCNQLWVLDERRFSREGLLAYLEILETIYSLTSDSYVPSLDYYARPTSS